MRARDADVARWLKPLDNQASRFATTAERALLRRLEGGCQVPLGALGALQAGQLYLSASVCALDGSRMLHAQGQTSASLENAVSLGQRVAEQLLEQGAAGLIANERGARRAPEGA